MKALVFTLLTLGSVVQAQPLSSANYAIPTTVLDGGGGGATSSNYALTSSSIGGIFGSASSSNYSTGSGYVEQIATLDDLMQGIDLKDYDSWITQFPSIPAADRDRTDDADGDGISNEEEFYALTDPTDAGSFLTLAILSVNTATNQTNLDFSPYESDSNLRSYQLLSRDDLNGAFSVISSNPGSGGTFQDNRTSTDKRFYRLRIDIPE